MTILPQNNINFPRSIQKSYILLGIIWLCVSWQSYGYCFSDPKEALAYKLAALHVRSTSENTIILDSSLEPDSATVAEFQWLLDSLKNRCLNPETEIADTIISCWRLIRNRGYQLTLLEIARALVKNTRDAKLFGNAKVDFKKASGYWTSKFEQKNGKTN